MSRAFGYLNFDSQAVPSLSIANGQVEVPIKHGWAAADRSGVIVPTAHRL